MSSTASAEPLMDAEVISIAGESSASNPPQREDCPMTFHRSEENAQVWTLECFDEEHPGSRYLIEFADGEAYVGELETAYDSDNAGELGIEMDDPLYDEFHQVIIKVFSEVRGDLRVFNEFVTIDYRDFPVRITERSTGQVIYGDPPAEVDR